MAALPVSCFRIMEQKASRSVAHFATKFCNALEKNKTTICSPLSAETVLALLALASRNQTREELLQALGLPDDDAIRSTFKSLTSTFESVKGVTLTMANKVYVKKEDNIKPEIMKHVDDIFSPKSSLSIENKPEILEMLDFSDGNAAADVVNKWVSKQTNDLIQGMVSRETFTENTRVLLLNAIYFKGNWETPFLTNFTADRDFFVDRKTTIKVPSMYMSDKRFLYGKSAELKSKLLQLPYKGGEASMVIVLPDDIEGLNTVLQQLAAGHDLIADIEVMREIKIDIIIPKFKAEMTIDLKDVIPKLVVKSIFDSGTSDIVMLTSDQTLFVSQAIQKAYIEVDESGTTAAACTKVGLRLCSMPRIFNANRPFLYLLTCHTIPTFIGVYEGSEYAQSRE